MPLGIMFKNENVNEDMVSILQQFFSYLPKTGDGGVDGQLFSGDQLTVERAVNVISYVANGLTPQDRLEGINLQGSCLLWVMSTEILVDIAVDTQSIVGRQSVDIAVDSRSIVGRHSVETRPIVVPDVSRPI